MPKPRSWAISSVAALCSSVTLCLFAGVAFTADAPPAPAAKSVMKQCKGSTGEVRKECEQVATEMAKPAPPRKEIDDRKMVTHSSGVMDTKEQRAVEAQSVKESDKKPSAAVPAPKVAPEKKDPSH